MSSSRKLDITAGLFFIAIAALVAWVAIPYGVQEPKKVKFLALSPSYYPRLVSYCLLGFGIMLLLTRLVSKQIDESDSDSAFRSNWVTILLYIIATLGVWYASLEYLGFVLSSALALFVLLLLAGERNKIALVVIPLILPLLLHGFFNKVANIPIPAGVLRTLIGGA